MDATHNPNSRSPLSCSIDFNAQHSPMGAFMSFTCGNFGTRGGIGLQIGQPGDQELFIGFKDGDRYSDTTLECLPFYAGAAGSKADAFLVEQAGPAEQNVKPDVRPFDVTNIKRYYSWCSDEWQAGPLSFTIYTPFGAIPDPAESPAGPVREALLPAVVATLEFDNTQGRETRTAIFAMNHARTGTRVLHEELGSSARSAFAYRREAGVAAEIADVTDPNTSKPLGTAPFTFMRWSPSDGVKERYNPVHLLGSCPGVGMEVPAGKRYRMTLSIGSFLEGVQTTGIEGRYLYTRHYSGLVDVLRSGLDRAPALIATAQEYDRQLECSKLSADQRFMIAHATHSYYGSTQLLDVNGQPLWVVNEGEYCMMNTLDLAVDQVFWELDRNPWVVRNLLDTFLLHYSYVDDVKEYQAGAEVASLSAPIDEQLARPYKTRTGGLSFCHDMGAHNNFAPPGHSSYELANLNGCFSYMTQEQLCNWVLTAACYVAKSRDLGWLIRHASVFESCLLSMINRGGDAGFAQFDSTRCAGGQEITTYDSLDHSLAQTRNNVYIAVKSWATYRSLALLFRDIGAAELERKCAELATRVAGIVSRSPVDGVLPAIFDATSPGYTSRILPAVEGLIYLLYFDRTGFLRKSFDDMFATSEERAMFSALREHTSRLLLDSEHRNLFDDGGIKLSSTSNNSWMSKIAIFMHITRRIFHLDEDERITRVFAAADAAHVKWQVIGSSFWACCDQIVSGEGKASRYYPRIITSALWLE